MQSELRFEHSRQAVQEVQTNSKTKLVPCSAGELIWTSCVTVCRNHNINYVTLMFPKT